MIIILTTLNKIEKFSFWNSRNKVSRWDKIDLIIDSVVAKHLQTYLRVNKINELNHSGYGMYTPLPSPPCLWFNCITRYVTQRGSNVPGGVDQHFKKSAWQAISSGMTSSLISPFCSNWTSIGPPVWAGTPWHNYKIIIRKNRTYLISHIFTIFFQDTQIFPSTTNLPD